MFGLLILLASIDDLIIDCLVALKVAKPRIPIFNPSSRSKPKTKKPKISVCIANWNEADVLKPMVEGNLKNIKHDNVQLVLGVYPNDEATVRVAESLAKSHPDRVKVVINRRNGPTSKGQMLNEIFAHLYFDKTSAPDLVVIHDSEDMIAPASFDLYTSLSRDYAMIQIPVFSLESRNRSLVGASYMEEFAERHTREMLLRSQFGAFVPSAGVGTCLRKDLIQHFLHKRARVLRPDSITEDYILGAEAHAAGFKTTFAAFRDPNQADNPIIATLEYFPKDLSASVRQKTRWVYGISFESTAKLGWRENGWNLFFQYRDRKGAITNILPLVSLLLMIIGLVLRPDLSHIGPNLTTALLFVLAANTLNIFVRITIKALAFRDVYGDLNVVGLLARWPVSLFINAAAVLRAWKMYFVESRFASRQVSWAKTTHEIPASFDLLSPIGNRLRPVTVEAKHRAWQVRRAQTAYSAVGVLGVVGLSLIFVWPQTDTASAPPPTALNKPADELVTAALQTTPRQKASFTTSKMEAPQAKHRKAIIQEPNSTDGLSTPESLREYLSLNSHEFMEDTVRKQLVRVAVADDLIVARAGIARMRLANGTKIDNSSASQAQLLSNATQKNTSPTKKRAYDLARKSLSLITARDTHILNYYRLVADSPASRRQRLKKEARETIQKSIAEDRKVELLANLVQNASIPVRQPHRVRLAYLTGTLNDGQRAQIRHSARSSLFASKGGDDALLKKMQLGAYSRPEAAQLVRGFRTDRGHARILARASIQSGQHSDEMIIARIQVTGEQNQRKNTLTERKADPPSRVDELVVVHARRTNRKKYRLAQERNLQILAFEMAETQPAGDATPSWKRVSALVRTAQRRANAWLRKNNFSLSEIGLAQKKRRSCGDLLCVDGILGIRTKTALIAISKRSHVFLRSTANRKAVQRDSPDSSGKK